MHCRSLPAPNALHIVRHHQRQHQLKLSPRVLRRSLRKLLQLGRNLRAPRLSSLRRLGIARRAITKESVPILEVVLPRLPQPEVLIQIRDRDLLLRLDVPRRMDREGVQLLVEVALRVWHARVIQPRDLREQRLRLVADVEVVVAEDIEDGVVEHRPPGAGLALPQRLRPAQHAGLAGVERQRQQQLLAGRRERVRLPEDVGAGLGGEEGEQGPVCEDPLAPGDGLCGEDAEAFAGGLPDGEHWGIGAVFSCDGCGREGGGGRGGNIFVVCLPAGNGKVKGGRRSGSWLKKARGHPTRRLRGEISVSERNARVLALSCVVSCSDDSIICAIRNFAF